MSNQENDFMLGAATRFYCEELEQLLTRTGWFVSTYATRGWSSHLSFVSAVRELNQMQRHGTLALAYLRQAVEEMEDEE